MLGMDFASTDQLLSSLHSTCAETASIAARLATCAREEFLRHFLHERSVSYARASVELRDHGASAAIKEDASELTLPAVEGELDGIATAWEAIECSALISFRDALDLDLPDDVLATLRRRIEDGVSALERLRRSGVM
jgi:hypothetical protein